jgi:hypothetical protein
MNKIQFENIHKGNYQLLYHLFRQTLKLESGETKESLQQRRLQIMMDMEDEFEAFEKIIQFY